MNTSYYLGQSSYLGRNNCITRRKEPYSDFKTTRLQDKSKKLFDPINKSFKQSKASVTPRKVDIKKETITALKLIIDYARLRNYDIRELLCHELTSTSFFLMQDGYLRKPTKSEFSREIEHKLVVPPPFEVPVLSKRIKTAIVIDFMAYARRVLVKKFKLNTYEYLFNNVWKTLCYLSRDCCRIDIVFDLYLKDSVKQYERERRSKADPTNTVIRRSDQPLPVEMDRFWASCENKVPFQQFFMKWITENYTDDKPLVPWWL